jgi:signal transduction histidine kinase
MRLIVDCPPLTAPVYVDRDMYEKVVLNLLSNAFKFTLEGEIEIGLRDEADSVEVHVRDTGTGIATDQLPHIFERFHRVEGTRARTHEGTGIGLALVQELVKLHHGTVSVRSVPGEGSTFTVTLPKGSDHLPVDRIRTVGSHAATTTTADSYLAEALRWTSPGPAPVADRNGESSTSGTRPRIVWADDNADMREYVARLLQPRYEVEIVADGEAALAAARGHPPDLVLADVMMPRLDGFGLLRELRDDERTRTVPVILLSARAGEEARVEGMQSGADDYLTKPFSARELLSRIDAHLKISQVRADADRRKDEFLATLAHELRNPLTPIRNSLHLLRLAGGEGEVAEQAHEMMERQVALMVRLVDDLLEVARITTGKIEIRKQHVDLAAAVLSAVETSRPLIEAGGHELTIELPPEPLILEADPMRLAQVLANLLNNAAKYTDEGGHIWLAARREGPRVVLSVRDNGAGIPTEMLPRVFDLFTQVDRTYRRAQGGLGIGLTLARNLVELHGGTIEARSDGPGKGSEFIVRMPLASRRFGVRHRERSKAQPAGAPPRHILVVDDNTDAADSLGMLLRVLGAEVYTAYDGPAALEALKAHRPSVMLLDVGLPGMDGFEVARRARQQPEGRELTVIALTGWGQDEDRRRSLEAGIDHHLVKPVDFSALEQLLSSLSPRR